MKIKYTQERPLAVLDTECYVNYWSIGFRNCETGKVVRIRKYNDSPLDTHRIATILRKYRVVGFNNEKYDNPMIALAMNGATNGELKKASDNLIQNQLNQYDAKEIYGVTIPPWVDYIDLQNVSPGSPSFPSLKIYAGRMHSKRMQSLPFPIDSYLTDTMVAVLEDYHDNDLIVTEDFRKELWPQILLRAIMSDEYAVDLRSKSDAQVAEAVIKTEIERLTGKKVWKPKIQKGFFKYNPPPYLKFKTPEMQKVLRDVMAGRFAVDGAGRVHEPEFLKGMKVKIGDMEFTMGIGGLHSNEKKTSHVADDIWTLLDRDVTSYYPAIILMMKLFPKHLGQAFLKVFFKIYTRRLHAKGMAKKCADAGDKEGATHWGNIAETLKIVLNGCFGKFGSPYSVLYSPDLMVATTMTGQFSVLMLIEDLVLQGMQVISANTDGFVTKLRRDMVDHFHAMIFDWECETGLGTEEVEYRAVYSQGVNAYLGIEKNGKAKRKGKNFTPPGPGLKGASGMKKNPFVEISALAVIEYLKDGTPIIDTIKACRDITRFVAIQKVDGGAEKDGEELGNAIRWYYATDTPGRITALKDGRSVGRTEGAKPCLELPDEFPDDIDYDWYEREATAVLEDFGFDVPNPKFVGRTGMLMARADDQKTFHLIEMPHNTTLCGRKPKSIRDAWIEARQLPAGNKLCPKCVKLQDL